MAFTRVNINIIFLEKILGSAVIIAVRVSDTEKENSVKSGILVLVSFGVTGISLMTHQETHLFKRIRHFTNQGKMGVNKLPW